MALTQETFLGASIRYFNGSIGWGTQPTTLEIGLVEDSVNGDSFNPPSLGTAAIFNYDQWQFTGILQSYKQEYGQQGNPVYTVQLQDPRELLAGVQLILQDYSGSTYGMSNIYNVYGYLEELYGFGGSQSNDSGIPWWLLRNAFYYMQLLRPIYFRGAYYLFDPFIGVPLLPNYYRVGGDSISALDFVQDIASAIACDFNIYMIPLESDETPAANAIKVNLIARNYPLRNNVINDFVETTEGAVAKQAGYELSNEVMSRFVVGGKLNNIYFQDQAYTANNREGSGDDIEYRTDPTYYWDDVIIPYWGHDAYGNLIIGTGDFNGETGKEYTFTLDGRPLYLQTGQQSLVNYRTDLAEMHAAAGGRKSWESFLWIHDGNPNSIHKGKAEAIGLTDGKLSDELFTSLTEAKTGGPLPKRSTVRNMNTKLDMIRRSNIANEEKEKQIDKVYTYIKRFATEYYGKKFMVRIPFVAGTVVPETNNLKFSFKPTSTGYVEEAYWGRASVLGYMPYNPEKFTDADNKLYAYARFSGMSEVSTGNLKSKYAFDRLSNDSYILDQYPNLKLGAMRENLFVKCSVDPVIVYLNSNTLFSPRVVITLDGPVPDAIINSGMNNMALLNELKYYLKDGETELEDAEVDAWVAEFGSIFGNDFAWKAKDADFNMPSMVAVPLENQILRYGPWYITNGAGKTEFENDSSLVPWGYGGFTAMNLAGWAKVQDSLWSQQVHETGSVEYPGVPTLSLGSALMQSGPIVTDINVAVGEAGVTTTYRMATWSHQFGRIGKYNVERYARLSKVAQEQRKAFRKFYGYAEPLKNNSDFGSGRNTSEEPPSITMVTSEIVSTGSEEDGDKKVVTSSAAMPMSTVKKSCTDTSYATKAAVSMDALYAPYTTKTDSDTGMPKFEEPEGGASTPTVDDLSPFGGDGIGSVFPETTSGLPDDFREDGGSDDGVKSIAFRSPLVLAGWGYDTDGTRVPDDDDYKDRADLWKVGPLDARWDDDRKVWSAGGGGGEFKIGKIDGNLFPGGITDVTIWIPNEEGFEETTETIEDAKDWFLPDGSMLAGDTEVSLQKLGAYWIITGAKRPC